MATTRLTCNIVLNNSLVLVWPQYADQVLVKGLYTDWETWYNGVNLTESQLGYVIYENKLQGVPRLRQVRVRGDSCIVPSDFKSQITKCYGPYSSGAEDNTPFGLMNGTAYVKQWH